MTLCFKCMFLIKVQILVSFFLRSLTRSLGDLSLGGAQGGETTPTRSPRASSPMDSVDPVLPLRLGSSESPE